MLRKCARKRGVNQAFGFQKNPEGVAPATPSGFPQATAAGDHHPPNFSSLAILTEHTHRIACWPAGFLAILRGDSQYFVQRLTIGRI